MHLSLFTSPIFLHRSASSSAGQWGQVKIYKNFVLNIGRMDEIMDRKKNKIYLIYVIIIVSYIAVWECAAWSPPPDGVRKGVKWGFTWAWLNVGVAQRWATPTLSYAPILLVRKGVTALLDREAANKWMPVLLKQVSQLRFYYIRNYNNVYSTILSKDLL